MWLTDINFVTHGQKSAKAYYLNKMVDYKNKRYENSYILKDMIMNLKKKKKKLSGNPSSGLSFGPKSLKIVLQE